MILRFQAFRVSLKNESQELLDYGRFMNLLWVCRFRGTEIEKVIRCR